MRNDVKVVRGLGVAMVSVFLVAGAAFAADSLTHTSGIKDGLATVSETAEPSGSAEPTETADTTETVERMETPEPAATAEPAGTPEPTETPDPTKTPKAPRPVAAHLRRSRTTTPTTWPRLRSRPIITATTTARRRRSRPMTTVVAAAEIGPADPGSGARRAAGPMARPDLRHDGGQPSPGTQPGRPCQPSESTHRSRLFHDRTGRPAQ